MYVLVHFITDNIAVTLHRWTYRDKKKKIK